MSVYKLKPLEWRWNEVGQWWSAKTPCGTVYVDEARFRYPDGELKNQLCDSRDHGKQLAWEWYESRMLTALEPVDPLTMYCRLCKAYTGGGYCEGCEP